MTQRSLHAGRHRRSAAGSRRRRHPDRLACSCTTARSSAAATTAASSAAARSCTARWTRSRTPAASPRSVYRESVLYTTLSPCAMCTGAILLYGIPHVIVGENQTFLGEEELLRSRGVRVDVVQDADAASR